MAPKVAYSHLEDRRRQILEAAARCFRVRGFRDCTMRDICREAKLSAGAVYNYFPSKEDIILALAEADRVNDLPAIRAALDSVNSSQAFQDLISMMFEQKTPAEFLAYAQMRLALMGEAVTNDPLRETLRQFREELRNLYIELVTRLQREGTFASDLDAKAITQVLFSTFYGLLVHLSIDGEVNLKDYVRVIRRLRFIGQAP